MTDHLSPVKQRLLDALRARRGTAEPADEVVRLRDGEPCEASVVLVHPIGGGVFCYAELARLMPGRRPVWAIAADSRLAGDSAPTVTELASHYLDRLAAGGVGEPAVLAGWSFGGLVAYEMARLSAARPPVVLIDTAPWPRDLAPWTPAETLEVFVEDLLGSDGIVLDRVPVDPALWSLPTPEALAAVGSALREQGLGLKLAPAELADRLRTFDNATRAMQRHRPETYAGRMVVMHAADSDADPEFWATRATGGQPTTVPLPGNHFTVLRPPTVARVAHAVHEAADIRPASPSAKENR